MKKTIFQYVSFLKGYRLYVFILFCFFFWMAFFDSNSLLTHRELNKEIHKLNRQKQFLQKEIEKDKEMLLILDTDEGRERLGREEYYLKHDNEDVYIIEHDTID
ncbi:septum formation initiator family protein [Capnocytophaga canis]|uniref:Septum formation initiator n=1 Tax=Capnocytophaga canis TaxID=1848903 RepID=A0A0B7IWD9_9FLAO|nr:septum formation initiator family protein [Capnocytophaga canis]CEN54238.1 Septum formation initiator [Capnocytophaga canis]